VSDTADRDVSLRELRNNVSDVLRRVEAGERLRVTVDRRPVAELLPLSRRRQAVPWTEVEAALPKIQADPGLDRDLRVAVADTTDDL
jgi:prevent-host-death family protein